ncbi:MAG TPA: phosphate propanoyltransferase [Firmicutes bacterium]|jgi:putative phosphotransacetylase|nr:phosphate propanoyltransferase [Bacillota bacterium]HAW70250.1 phosphate propanoyltransferase [Bacillota bacterium]HBE06555.1 phosphate propanoyltransferase [Bacillota bacterium]HBG44694.1 phosphate propanoyltransferase [Bacillota bacterium]HBL51356.1 phosphate propanoyltransferase [Bacillota bacterium]
MEKQPLSIPVGVSNRHLHLSQADLEVLFGKGYQLTVKKDLGQPGQFAAEETVDVQGPKNTISRIRILGPIRKQTQIEVSLTDSFTLGITPPVRDSGSLAGSPGVIVKGPQGQIELKEGVVAAKRHIHCTPEEAVQLGVKDMDIVSVAVKGGERSLTFGDVLVRVRNDFALEFHVDTDEANAAALKNGDLVHIVR